MSLDTVRFVGSFPSEPQCPKDEIPEYAFIGRSNVGKSSLINMLVERKQLAKVSSTPGKTQLINFFKVDEKWHLVDLPGYGYARISKVKRKSWHKMIDQYMLLRNQLQCAFLLIDGSIPPQKIDLEFMATLAEAAVPFVIIFTKKDKCKPLKWKQNLKAFEVMMMKEWDGMPESFISSAKKSEGRNEIIRFIESINEEYSY